MELSKEVKAIFSSVMRVQQKNAVSLELIDINGSKKLHYDVCNIDSDKRYIVVDDINIIISEECEKAFDNVRFVVKGDSIALECITHCAECKLNCGGNKDVSKGIS